MYFSQISGIFRQTVTYQAITAYIKAGHLYLLPSPHQQALSPVGQEFWFPRWLLCTVACIGNAMAWSCKGAIEISYWQVSIGYDGLRCAWLPVCHSSRATTRLLMLPTMDGVHGAKHVSISELLLDPFSRLASFRISSVAFYCCFWIMCMCILQLFSQWRLDSGFGDVWWLFSWCSRRLFFFRIQRNAF